MRGPSPLGQLGGSPHCAGVPATVVVKWSSVAGANPREGRKVVLERCAGDHSGRLARVYCHKIAISAALLLGRFVIVW